MNLPFVDHVKSPKAKITCLQKSHNTDGLAGRLTLHCSNCQNDVVVRTSNFTKRETNKPKRRHDINVRSVLASQTVGHSGLKEFCAVMDLPPPVCTFIQQNSK